MGKNQGFVSVNLSEARDNSTWAVSWLAELTVTPSRLPPFSPLTPVCPSQKPPCVDSKRPRVYRHPRPHVANTCARGAGTHGDVLNLHTEVFSACQAAPHSTPHTHTTHNTAHNTHTHHTHHTHHTTHNTHTTWRQRLPLNPEMVKKARELEMPTHGGVEGS